MTQNDVMTLLIGKDLGAVTPTTAKGAVITDYSKLADGEMAVVNSQNVVLSATSVLTDDQVKLHGVKVIQRSGTELIASDLIKQENILTYKGQVDVAAAEQITYIGYNGTTGSITAANSKLYVVRVSLREQDLTGQGQEIILNAPYKSDSSATQLEVGNGLALSLANTMNRQTVKPISVELLSSAAYFATAVFANTVTVVKGEKLVSVATNRQYNTSVALAVGDFVRFSAAPATTGSAVTDGVYKVVELVSTLQFMVDRPIEVASTAYTAAKLGATVISASRALAGNFGIKLSGIARPFTLGKYPYSKVSFHVGLDSASSFGDTAVNYSQAMTLGQGTYNQIAQLERDLLGNRGSEYVGDFMHTHFKNDATSGKMYDQLGITFYGDHPTAAVGATPRRMKQLLLAFETGFSNDEPPDVVIDVLDAYSTVSSGIGV